MAILSAIMGHPAFAKDWTLVEQLQTLERLGDEYYKTAGVNIAEDILLTTLVRSLPWTYQHDIPTGSRSCGCMNGSQAHGQGQALRRLVL